MTPEDGAPLGAWLKNMFRVFREMQVCRDRDVI